MKKAKSKGKLSVSPAKNQTQNAEELSTQHVPAEEAGESVPEVKSLVDYYDAREKRSSKANELPGAKPTQTVLGIPPPPPLKAIPLQVANEDMFVRKDSNTPNNMLRIEVSSWGYEDSSRNGYIKINGETHCKFHDKMDQFRGVHLVTVKTEGGAYKIQDYQHFDVWKSEKNVEKMVTYVETLQPGTLVIGGTADEPSKNIKQKYNNVEAGLKLLNLSVSDFYYRGALAFIVKIGDTWIHKLTSKAHEGPLLLKKVVTIQEDNGEVASSNLPGVILASDLHKQLKKLKSTSKQTPTFVDRRKIFDDDDSNSFFPLRKIKTIFEVPYEQAVAHLDLTGIDQVTDLFFYLMKQQQRLANALRKIKHISIRGCYSVTDQGVQWMTEAMPSLESVASIGCRLLTEKSIFFCVSNCKKIETVNVVGSNIGNFYLPEQYKLGAFKLRGCPLVTSNAFHSMVYDQSSIVARNTYFEELRNGKDLLLFNAVVIKSEDAGVPSLLKMFSDDEKQKDRSKVHPLSVEHLAKYKDAGYEKTFNFTECPQELADMYFGERTLYILPYNLNGTLDESKYDIVARITQVLAQIPTASFVIVPIEGKCPPEQSSRENKENESSDELNKEEICRLLDKKVKHHVKVEGMHALKVLESLKEDIDFRRQQMLGQSIALSYNLLDVIENESRIMFSEPAKDENEWKNKFHRQLEDAANEVQFMHPWFLKFSQEFQNLVENYTPFDEKIMTESAFAKRLKEKDESAVSEYTDSYIKIIEYLHMMGSVVYVKPQPYNSGPEGEGLVVTDPAWFAHLLNKVMNAGDLQKERMRRVVHKTTPVWTKKELEQHISELVPSGEMYLFWELLRYTSLWMDLGVDGEGIFTPHIPDAAPVEKSHYFPVQEMLKDSEFHQIKCEYKLLQPLPMSFFMKLAGNPIMDYKAVWKYGLIHTNLPVETLIHWENVDSFTYLPNIEIICQLPGIGGDIRMLWTEIHRITTLMETMFSKHGLIYARKITVTSDNVYNEKAEKPEDALGIVARCSFSGNHGDGNSKEDLCNYCGNTFTQSQLLWQMDHYLKPTFSSELKTVVTSESAEKSSKLTIKGCWISSNKKEQLILKNTLHVEDNNSMEISLKSGTCVGLGFTGRKDTIFIDVPKCTVEHHVGDKPWQNRETVKVICPIVLETGSLVQMNIYRDQKKQIHMKLKHNYVTVCDVIVEDDPQGFTPFLESGEMCGFLVKYNTRSTSMAPSTLVEGMRLEAIDRSYPDRICVSTIDQIEGEKVRVHFDGWTNKYDYWTTINDKNIHPVGYFDQIVAKKLSPKYVNQIKFMNLQEPYNYGKKFSWITYLPEVKAHPVPFHLFSSIQTEGCKQFLLNDDTLAVGFCKTERNRPGVIREHIKKNVMDISLQWYKNYVTAPAKYWPVVFPLPETLSRNYVLYPNMKTLLGTERTVGHFLCPSHNNHHFILENTHKQRPDKGPLILGMQDIKLMASYFSVVCAQLISQDCLVSGEFTSLFPEASGLTEKQCLVSGEFTSLFPEASGLTEKQVNRGLKEYLELLLLVTALDQSTMQHHTLDSDRMQKVNQFLGMSTEKMEYNDMLCPVHYKAINFYKMGLDVFQLDEFKQYGNTISKLYIGATDSEDLKSFGWLTSLPEPFFASFPNLKQLVLKGHKLTALPPNINQCRQLELLDVSYNPITELPGIEELEDTLTVLDISHTKVHNIPDNVFKLVNLTVLGAEKIQLDTLQPEIGNLTKLTQLSLAENCLTSLPDELAKCQSLIDLDLSGIKWANKNILSYNNFTEMLNDHPYTANIDEKKRRQMFHGSDHEQKVFLNEVDIGKLNLLLFMEFPRLRATGDDKTSILKTVLCLTNLENLNLSYQGLITIPEEIKDLVKLTNLDISHNPILESVAAEVSTLTLLKSFELRGCPSLKTPPREIVNKGFKAVHGYLRRLLTGSVSCKRTKLMMVGLGGAGKTSLVECLQHKTKNKNHLSHGGYGFEFNENQAEITDGIDIVDWKIETEKDGTITYSIWDFAGQTVYYNTHQFFLSNRAVYLLIWNIRLGYEHAGLDFWLNSIACHAPKAPVIIVGTHRDQVDKYWLPAEEMRRKYSQIRSFHAISVFHDIGVNNLVEDLVDITLQEKYMGEKIPEAWLNFEIQMEKEKSKGTSLLKWNHVQELAENVGIMDKMELHQAIGFLHDLGSVQHFKNTFLKSRVVINPQWIVDAMACVVSVHDTPIVDGRFFQKDIARVWSKYEEDLHLWLLRLTEEFDLTFPIPDEDKSNIVPCLLPPEPPEYSWPEVDCMPGFRETKMIYKFDYLPAGLFNRAQVRLYQYCDSSVIWKKGSRLMKNGHHALIIQHSDSEVAVKAQGYRPENVIFLVHEVFESLIAESFHGVTYDYFVPCTDCLKVDTYDPCMFPASKVRKATELKAPFLQCDKYFHTLSLAELHAVMPPTSNSDFDMHLEKSIRDLEDIQSDLVSDVFMVYCDKDIPQIGEEEKRIHPRKIYEDLTNNGFKVWFPIDPAHINLQLVSVTMRDSKVVLICISDEFVADQQMCDIFHYAKTNVQKNIQLVVLGSSFNWKNSSTGLLVSSDVFVNMMQPSRYQHKLKELLEGLKIKTSSTAMVKEPVVSFPKCFISYSWQNSTDAVNKGTKGVPGSVGWGDPRRFKDVLEKEGIACWLDVDRVNQGGLFEEIADGLKNAKVMVACVSDEYAKSKNCQLEFRFAAITLKIPMVVAVVGTGDKWETSELGMLSLGATKINFQHDSTTANERLVNAVKAILPEDDDLDDGYESRTPSTSDNNQAAFQELIELAQRKFLRQVSHIAEGKGYPRLFILDFLSEEEKNDLISKNFTDGEKCSESLEKGDAENNLEEQSSEQVTGFGSQASLKSNTSKQATGRPKSSLKKRSTGLSVVAATVAIQQLAAKEESVSEEDTVYCVRFMCENEESWHCHGECLPISVKSADIMELMDTMAPYMARLLAILRYAGVNLDIVVSEKGEKLRKQLEEKCGSEPEFSKEYEEIRDFVKEIDKERTMGGLSRCHLPSGKFVWLCPKHQMADDRITVLDVNDGEEDTFGDPDEETITAGMLDNMSLNMEKWHASAKSELKTDESASKSPPKDPAKNEASDAVSSQSRPTPKKRTSTLATSKLRADGKLTSPEQTLQAVANSLNNGNTNKSKACVLM